MTVLGPRNDNVEGKGSVPCPAERAEGDVLIDIADSRFGLKVIGNSNLPYVSRVYPEGEMEIRNTLFSDMKFIDAAYRYATATDTWTTTTDEVNSYQGDALTLLNVNDYFYWGCTSTDGFSRLYFDFATVASPSLTLIWEYSTSTDSVHDDNIDWPNLQGTTTTDDTADHFTADGNIDWTIPGDWGVSQLGDGPTDLDDHYWIRVHTSTAIATPPTVYFAGLSRYGGDFMRLATDGADKFRIDKDGDLYIAGKIGVATANASTSAHIISTSEQLRLGQDTANYSQFKTDSAGDLHLTASGDDIEMADDNLWICSGGTVDSSSCPSITVSTKGNLILEGNISYGNAFSTTTTFSAFTTAESKTANLTGLITNNAVVRKLQFYISNDISTSTNINFRASFYNADSMTEDELIKDFYFNLAYTGVKAPAWTAATTTGNCTTTSGFMKYDLFRILNASTPENARITDVDDSDTLTFTTTAYAHALSTGVTKIQEFTDLFQLYDADDTEEIHAKLEALSAPASSMNVTMTLELQ